jgi:hypothetical protein
MTTRRWIDAEPGPGACVRQLSQLFANGVRHPVHVAIGAAILCAVVLGFVLLGKTAHTPRFVLRVVETGRDPRDLPRPRRQLAEYVTTGIFTSAPLLDLVRRYELYPGLFRKSPRAALETFREDIEVEVYRNYFVEERTARSSPRSARLSISYKHTNPDVAVSVTRDLGALIVAHERSMRRQQAARAADEAKREVEARRELLQSRQLDVALKRAELETIRTRDPKLEIEFADLAASTAALALRQDLAERREAELSVGAALEASGLGLSFEVINDGSLPARSERADTESLLVSASLAAGLPLLIVGIGAFVPKKGRT